MIRRSVRIALEVVLGVVAGVAVLGGIAVWRLSAGPVHLDFLTPYLEEALADPAQAVTVDVGATVLTWGGWPRTVDLRARNTRVFDKEGATLAVFPEVSVLLSTGALIRGTVAPTSIDILGASLELVRDRDGELRFGARTDAAGKASEESDFSQLVPAFIDDFLSDRDPSSVQAYLDVVRIVEASLSVRDEKLGIDWLAPTATLELRRDDLGLSGEVILGLVQQDELARIEVAFIYEKASRFVDVATSLSGLRPESFASLSPELAVLNGLRIPLGGTAAATLALDGSIQAVEFHIKGEAGTVEVADRTPEPLAVRQLTVAGSFDRAARRLRLTKAALDFGAEGRPGPSFSLSGELAQVEEEDLEISGAFEIAKLPADEMARYWPIGVSEGGREWVVENVRTGINEAVKAEFALRLPGGDFERVEIAKFGGTMRFRDMDVHYLRPMPPVGGVSGTGTFDQASMRLTIESGAVNDIEAVGGEVLLEGLDVGKETMFLDIELRGPLQNAMELINHERLALLDKMGLDPAAFTGQTRNRLTFRFPLLEDLAFEQVTLTSNAVVEQAVIKGAFLEHDATEGRVEVDLTEKGMRVTGPMKLGGVPIELDWEEDFTGRRKQQSLYKVLVPSMDNAQRARFGFDFLEGLRGPVAASVVASVNRDRTTLVNVALNLQEASLEFPAINWSKAKGVPGKSRISLKLVENRLTEMQSVELEAEGLRLAGSGRFDEASGRLELLELSNIAFGASTLTNVTLLRGPERQEVTIGGGTLDAVPYIASDRDTANDTAAAEEPPAEPEATVPLRVVAPSLTAVYFAPGRYLEDVSLALEIGPRGWSLIDLKGTVPRQLLADRGAAQGSVGDDDAPKRFDLKYGPSGDGLHRLEATSNDIGAVLYAMDVLDTVEGGTLELTGQGELGKPLAAQIDVEDFTARDAPVLARLLLVASLTGILEGLTSDGVAFDRLTGEFTLLGGVVESELMRAYGSSIGLTMKGSVDFGASTIDTSGTIVPAYTLNRILNNIPILGTILTGGEGGGILAFVYSMQGDLAGPEVSVNPLSALAPGFLRGVFSGEGVDKDKPTVFPPGHQR